MNLEIRTSSRELPDLWNTLDKIKDVLGIDENNLAQLFQLSLREF